MSSNLSVNQTPSPSFFSQSGGRDYTFVSWNGRLYMVSISENDQKKAYLPEIWKSVETSLFGALESNDAPDNPHKMATFTQEQVGSVRVTLATRKIEFFPAQSSDLQELTQDLQARLKPYIDQIAAALPQEAATPPATPPPADPGSTSGSSQATSSKKKRIAPLNQINKIKAQQRFLGEAPLSDQDFTAALDTMKGDKVDYKLIKDDELLPSIDQKTGRLMLPVQISKGAPGDYVGLYVDFYTKTISYYDPKGKSLDAQPKVAKIVEQLNKELFNDKAKVNKEVKAQKKPASSSDRYLLSYFSSRLMNYPHKIASEREISEKQLKKEMRLIASRVKVN